MHAGRGSRIASCDVAGDLDYAGAFEEQEVDYTFMGSNGTSIAGTGVVAAAAVPEPATISLVVASMLGIILLRRRA